jgi:hypothetical protein
MIITNVLKIIPQNKRETILPNSFCEGRITLIAKADTDTTKSKTIDQVP